MSSSGTKPLQNPWGNSANNPFARALSNVETEQSLSAAATQPNQLDPFSDLNEAYSKTGGNFDFGNLNSNDATNYGDLNNLNNDAYSNYNQDQGTIFDQQAEAQRQQQEEAERQQKLALHKKRHTEIHQIHNAQLFDAKREQNTKAINEIRQQLSQIVHATPHPETTLVKAAITEERNAGIERAQGLRTYYEQAIRFAQLLKESAQNSGLWATQLTGKKAKSKQKGMQISGRSHEKTSTIQDMTTNHERNTQFSGG